MKAFLAAPALLMVAGCAGFDHAMEYSGVEIVMVTTQRADFRVFDKPEESRMMVTPTIGAAAGQGFLSGLTFGAADTGYPKPWFQEAAEAHLSNTGRAACKIFDGYEIINPQWEFLYRCPGAPPLALAPPVATK